MSQKHTTLLKTGAVFKNLPYTNSIFSSRFAKYYGTESA